MTYDRHFRVEAQKTKKFSCPKAPTYLVSMKHGRSDAEKSYKSGSKSFLETISVPISDLDP